MQKMVWVLLIIGVMVSAVAVVAQDEMEQPPIGLWEECATPENLPDEILFGAPLGLTGPISIYGIPEQQGVDLAVQEINESGYLGNGQIVVQYEDTEGDAQQAINAMTKLIEEDGVMAVFGPSLSSEAFAADPIAQENGIPVMGVTTSATEITNIGDFVFRGNLPEFVLIPDMVAQVDDLVGLDNVAILYGDDDDFTITGYDQFVIALDDNGVNIVEEATFARGDVDFNPQLTRILAAEPDAIAVSALASEGIQIIVQARELGYDGLILGGNGFNTPDVAVQAGEDAEGLIIGASWNINGENNALSERFVGMFQDAYGIEPDQFAVQAYTVMWLFATSIRCQDSVDGAAIRDGLFAIDNFESPLGAFSFDEIGEPLHPSVTQIIQDGQFIPFTSDMAADMDE